MATATYTKTGNKATTAAKLDKAVFGVEVTSHELLKQAYTTYLSNGRSAGAKVKTRGLVRGGGKKPWKQKGTGRARFGSSRNPIWRGGGIVFGPTGHENYVKDLSTKAKRQAIRQALSLSSQEGKVSVIEALDFKTGKTADAVKLLTKLGADRNVLLVVDNKTPETVRAVSNLGYVKLVQSRYINVYDAMNADHIIITSEGLKGVTEWLGGAK
ncbi:MAG: large subunit ribosomal protein [Patescibacteria group bacterium]|nr:large subunit ribosomal protein [Patescibacteria group bacterium]